MEHDPIQDPRELLTQEELAELLPSRPEYQEDGSDSLSPTLPLDEPANDPTEGRSLLIEQTLKQWERTVLELRIEVRELRNRIDQLERQRVIEKPRLFPIAVEPPSVPAQEPVEERLSRSNKYKSGRSRWF
jgi:hypothetical protein